VDIVDAFNRAGATTIAADANALAPALYRAHQRVLVPRVDGDDYVPALTDLDQVVLADAREEIGTLVLLPAAEIVERLADKYLAHVLFEERGIDSPPTWLPNGVPDDAPFPLLVKAREGFGSRHIYRAEDRAQLG